MDFETFKQKLFEDRKFKNAYEDKSDLAFEISEMVHEARVKAGLTQARLAKKIGTKQSSIARIESETTLPSLSFLKKIAEALGTYLIPPKFASLAMETKTQTLEEPNENLWILDTNKFKIRKTSTNSGQMLVHQ